jgi:hypothetical protein
MRRTYGSGTITKSGYLYKVVVGLRKAEHVLIAEKALGKQLPKGAEVHHVDGNGLNNNPWNLVVCPNRAYHFLLHQRQRAYEACGNADYIKCPLCKTYDKKENLEINSRGSGRHSECRRKYQRKAYNDKPYVKKKSWQILAVEKALGKELPNKAVVFHVDGYQSKIRLGSLVVCPDQEYHKLLYRRQKALEMCGNPNYRKCKFCNKYDDQSNLVNESYHLNCQKLYDQERYRKDKNGYVCLQTE